MTSKNPTLDKNLDPISRYNPRLKQKLLDLPYLTNDIQLVETHLKEPNLKYNDLFLHSQEGAEKEAKDLFAKSNDSNISTHFILGIGLGHLFKEFCDYSKGKIILYESNLEILRVTLELVDLSKELSKPNVKVVSDYKELKEAFTSLYEYKTNIGFSILNSYRTLYGEEAQKILTQIELYNGTSYVDYKSLKEKGFKHLETLINNIPYIIDTKPLYNFKDIYKDKTALIISAGPTLDLNIETIKKNRDKVIIFCVGTAIKALIKNNITPDFLNIIEVGDFSGQLRGLDLSNIDMVLEPSTNNSFYKVKSKKKFIFPPIGSPWCQYWGKLFNTNISPYITKGTVSFQALESAKMLGCKKLVLVGQDLAFVNNACYSKGASYSELVFELNPKTGKPEYKINDYESYIKSFVPDGVDINESWCKELAQKKIDSFNENLIYIKGIKGDMIPTEAGYAMFIDFFKEFADLNQNLELINTSMIGAQIDGFSNIPLEKVLENTETLEKKEFISEFNFNEIDIIEKLKADLVKLNEINEYIEKAVLLLSKYEKEITLRKIITEEAIKIHINIAQIYDKLSMDYYKNFEIYNIIVFGEHIEIQHLFKQINNFPKEEKINKMHSALKEYFYNAQEKIPVIKEKIQNALNKLRTNG